jgi:hypothetical protein
LPFEVPARERGGEDAAGLQDGEHVALQERRRPSASSAIAVLPLGSAWRRVDVRGIYGGEGDVDVVGVQEDEVDVGGGGGAAATGKGIRSKYTGE